MKIVHQISFNDTEDGPRCRFLREQRIAVAFTSLPAPPTCTDPTGLVTVSVEEADPAWPLLRDRIEDWRVVDSVTTLFTDEDRAGARYFSLEPEWQHGYPPDAEHAEQARSRRRRFGSRGSLAGGDAACSKCTG